MSCLWYLSLGIWEWCNHGIHPPPPHPCPCCAHKHKQSIHVHLRWPGQVAVVGLHSLRRMLLSAPGKQAGPRNCPCYRPIFQWPGCPMFISLTIIAKLLQCNWCNRHQSDLRRFCYIEKFGHNWSECQSFACRVGLVSIWLDQLEMNSIVV
jgi:hypothetical protein